MVQARDDGGLDKDGSGRDGEKWSDSGYSLNMKPTGFSNELDVRHKEREKSRMTP